MSCTLTFREQLKALLDENIDKYPDAVRWMMDASVDVNLDKKTEYELFVARLSGTGDRFGNSPYNTKKDNFVTLVKWYRDTYGGGLKQAKIDCENHIKEKYPYSPRARLLR